MFYDDIHHYSPSPRHPASPLHSQVWVELFFRPHRFFASLPTLTHVPYLYLCAWLAGIARTIGRIDKFFMQAEFGYPRAGWDDFETISWLGFWAIVVIGGATSAPFIWWLGGWWYRLRLRWSDAKAPDGYLARQVYFYSAIVETLPAIVATLLYTLVYPNYASAYAAAEPFSLVLVIFPFWALVSSYVGVSTCFETTTWKRVLWFLVLPILLYVGALVAVGIGYASLTT